jgi:hypothetical protein
MLVADNASSNDTQTTTLASLNNSFNEVNRVRCFNHTLQLSAKTLLQPFNASMSSATAASDEEGMVEDLPTLEEPDDEEDDESSALAGCEEADDPEDDINELDTMSGAEWDEVLEDTAVVQHAVSKVPSIHICVLSSTDSVFAAAPTFIRHHSFHYHCPTWMAAFLQDA